MTSLGDFLLEDAHFAELTKIIRFLADEYAEGRVLSVLEGGYNLKRLGIRMRLPSAGNDRLSLFFGLLLQTANRSHP